MEAKVSDILFSSRVRLFKEGLHVHGAREPLNMYMKEGCNNGREFSVGCPIHRVIDGAASVSGR